MTELQVYMNFDEEVSITTKSYVCTLLLLYVMAKTIIGEFFTNETEIQNVEAFLGEVRRFLQDQKQINKLWKELLSSFGYDIDFLEILSRGSSLTSAHQAALNFKEIVKSYSEASSISTFRHGGIECLKESTKLIILSSDKENFEFNIQFIDKLVNDWACGKILHITNQEFDEKAKNLHDEPKIITYKHKIKDPHLAPIMEIIILQLLFYKMAEKKGIEPGKFLYSQKITNDI
jgi:glucosamine--fructose-6-phosphate aminotransferase (isomerizing)